MTLFRKTLVQSRITVGGIITHGPKPWVGHNFWTILTGALLFGILKEYPQRYLGEFFEIFRKTLVLGSGLWWGIKAKMIPPYHLCKIWTECLRDMNQMSTPTNLGTGFSTRPPPSWHDDRKWLNWHRVRVRVIRQGPKEWVRYNSWTKATGTFPSGTLKEYT